MKRLKQIIISLLARTHFQKLYEIMFYISLKGMNYGSANSPQNSGEISVLKFLKKRLPKNPVIFDVGANYGQYLNLLNNHFSQLKPQIHAFEPNNKAYNKLKIKFGNLNNIFIINKALGEKQIQAKLYFDKPGSVRGTLVDTIDFNKGDYENVEIISLDYYCEINKISKIHFLKIDVEGYELNLLKGALGMINESNIEFIQLEHGSLQSLENEVSLYKIIKLLSNYDCYHIKQNGIRKLNYKPFKEIYFNSNYFFKLRRS